MATIVYLPPDYGGNPVGKALGQALGAYTAGKFIEKKREKKSAALGELFSSIQNGDYAGAKKAITQIPDADTSDIINLIGELRRNNQTSSGLVKIPAFDQKGREVPFAVTKEELATGSAMERAKGLGLTLAKPGKQIDYYQDSPLLKYVGSGTPTNRIGLTMEEWKAKYGGGKGEGKPTEKQMSIQDYLQSKGLENNAVNRNKARQYLFNVNKAVEVINSRFGTKTGNDWTFDSPEKSQAAALAKTQLEGLIINDNLDPVQAGQKAAQIAEQQFNADKPVGFFQSDKWQQMKEGLPVEEKPPEKTLLDDISELVNKIKAGPGGTGGQKDNEGASTSQPESAEQVDFLGEYNGTKVVIPKKIESPKAQVEYIQEKYNIPRPDAIRIVLENN